MISKGFRLMPTARAQRAVGSSVAVLLAGISGTALAQQQQAQLAVEEITVTARRTQESLQDVPLQVSALTTDMLRDNVVTNLREINNLAPGLNYQGNIGRVGTGRVFFRGLNAGSSTAASSSKGSVFLDGTYFASSAQDIPFEYFQRIEAMPGPQSALFGRATFGGALNYVTKDPTEEFSGRVSVDAATLGEYAVHAFYGGPLMEDKLLGSIMLSYSDYDGPKDYKAPPDILHPEGVKQGGQTTLFGAGKLVFQPSDDFRLEAHVMRNKDDDDPVAFARLPFAARNGVFTLPNGTQLTFPVGTLKIKDLYGRRPGGFPYFQHNWYNIPDPRRHTESWRPQIQATYTVADHDINLSLFHEYEWYKEGGNDTDYSSFPNNRSVDRKQLTQSKSAELTVFSPQDKELRYKFGAYYLRSTLDITAVNFTSFRCNTMTSPTNLTGCDPLTPSALFNPTFVPSAPGSAVGTLTGFSGVVQSVPATSIVDTRNGVTNHSVFGSISYDFTEQITLDLEARYQGDKIQTFNNIVGGFRGEKTFKKFLPRVNLQYKFDDDKMVYALYSIGNNPGGFNASQFIGAPGTNTTEAEHRNIPEEELLNYEVGLKATWLEGRLVTNISAFHMKWKNQTTTVTFPDPQRNTTLGLLLSQGNSRVNGLAAEISGVVGENWTYRATLSRTAGKYTDWCSTNLFQLTGVASPGRLGCVDTSGNPIDGVPPWSGSLTVGYTQTISGDWNGVVRMTYQYQDGMYESDMALVKSEVGHVFNFTAGVENDMWTIETYCSNCFQEVAPYRIVRLVDPRSGPLASTNAGLSITPRKPRQFGIRSTYQF